MILRRFKIGDVIYFCNELQIKEAGGLEQAAKKLHEEKNPKKKQPEKADKPNE